MKQGIKQVKTLRGRALWLALVVLGLPPVARAQAQHAPRPDTVTRALPALLGDTIRVRLELQPDSLVAVPVPSIDSARLEWLRTPPTMRDLVCDRVGCFETEVPHQFNNSVMAYVTLFTARNRSYLQRVLERENFYFPIFEKYLAQYNLPTDLKYLAVVESALIPTAKSPVGATGLWQFMGPTAGDLRLKRDEWIDERMHPEKATEAACKHLRYLYGIFHDWELVLAAYNWGAGSVQRVMRRTGKKTFWDLYPYMPAETRNYVPTFTAIMYSMKYAEAHGLRTPTLRYQYAEALDTLGLRGQAFDLRRLSRACGYSDSLYLSRFNPELRRAALPAGYRPYVVRFPAAAAEHLGDVDRATLLAYCEPAAELPRPLTFLPPRLEGVEPWPSRALLAATAGPRAAAETSAPHFRRVAHTVRRGETVASLAERFEVSPAQLRRWNELPKNRSLKPGRELLVFVPLPATTAPRTPAREAVPVPETVALAAAPTAPVVDEEVLARREQATANAHEVARLQELIKQEKQQELRLVAIRQRQAVQQAAAEVQARAAARQLAQAQSREVAKAEVRAQATAPAAAEISVAKTRVVEPKASETAVAATADEIPALKPTQGVYTVRKGDYLTKLARERGLSVAQLIAWNELESETVVPGQKLIFQAPTAGEATGSEAARPKPRRETAASHPEAAKVALAGARLGHHAEMNTAAPQVHRVQQGDTLFNISRRFNVSVQVLRELNHLKSDDVKLGQKLLVPQS
ncbi:LysM peptidoglycan-binding domain-containing protein [Hymenobacter sp. UYCo722]|uniref:LysM peptidoglycan-binding domain-containing protein n=1 Tax=Hymenobacter sp. UYCo722 TaxID=3156335 RepID=UPI003397C639